MTDPSPDPFPQRLRAARDLRGMSQGQLGERARLPPSSISHFEGGARKPSFDNLRRLASALEVTTDYLLGRANEAVGNATPQTIHRHLSELSDKDLETVGRFAAWLAQENGKPGGGS